MTGHNKRDYLRPSMKRWLSTVKEDSPESTYNTRKTQIRAFCRWLDEHGIEVTEFAARNTDQEFIESNRKTACEWYANWMDNNYAESTVVGRVTACRQFYEDIKDRGLVEQNPWEDFSLADIGLSNPTSQQSEEIDEQFIAVSPEEVQQLCRHVPEPRVRNELIIKLLWQTGMRQDELSKVKLENVYPDERRIDFYPAKKEDPDLTSVWYDSSLDILMTQWMEGGYRDRWATSDESDSLLLTHKKPKMSPRVINRMVVEAAKRAKIQTVLWEDGNGNNRYRITGHSLRHGYATYCANETEMPIHKLKRLMNHKDIDTTLQYVEEDEESLKEAQSEYGPS